MIVKVKKFLIFGLLKDKNLFFDQAQKMEFLEFIEKNDKKYTEMALNLKDLLAAIKILKKQPPLDGVYKKPFLSLDDVVKEVIQINERLEKLRSEEISLKLQIDRIAPFGNFSVEDIRWIEREGKRVIQFFCLKTKREEGFEIPPRAIYLGTDYDMDYFVSIGKIKEKFSGMIEIQIEHSLHDLKRKKLEVMASIKECTRSLKLLTSYSRSLQKYLINILNGHNLERAKKLTTSPEESLFFVEAWVPEDKVEDLLQLIGKFSVDIENLEILENERVPTYLENKGFAKLGEDLVFVYDTPSVEDNDPSLWIFVFFSIFFAIIVSDAGYGLLYLGVAWLINKKASFGSFLKRLGKLTMVLGVCCVVWGCLIGSFFGVDVIPRDSLYKAVFINKIVEKKAKYHFLQKDDTYQEWLKKYPKVLEAKNEKEFIEAAVKEEGGKQDFELFSAFKNNILMELALFLGALHISLSLLRYLKKHWSAVGWVIFIIGGYLYFPFMVGATSFFVFMNIIDPVIAKEIGLQLIFLGIILAVILAIFQKKLEGVMEVLTVVQVFSDILSYLRLYALGLAGMIMASVFNSVVTFLPFYIAIFILIIGHIINFSLGLVSGCIHGLRLNFIEWYHYSFDGNGKEFNPLKLLK